MFFDDLIKRMHYPAGRGSMYGGCQVVLTVLALSLSGCELPPPDNSPLSERGMSEIGSETTRVSATDVSATDSTTMASGDSAGVPAPSDRSTVFAPFRGDGAWAEIGAGLELRVESVQPRPESATVRLITLRVDPGHNIIDVAYRPEQPLSLDTWQARTNAPIIFNGGYFTEEYVATGLVVAGGQPHGTSYGGFAGMLAVTSVGPEVRWLRSRPYDPSEPLRAALQSFPMLVLPGGLRGFDEPDGQAARRTAIAQDTTGRFLVVVAPDGGFTLSQFSATLVDSDLDLDIAVNLDGGASTGFIIQDPPVRVESFGPLPTVVTIRPRQDASP